MEPRPFLLLEPGPLVPDEPHQRGDSNLLEANCLGNIARAVLSGRAGTGDYATRVMCLTDWRRSGTAYDLAPLARQMPPAGHAQLKPLPPGVLERAFTLQPGGCRLTEAEKGDLLQTNLGGYGTPAATAGGSAGVNTTVPSASLGGAAAATGAAPNKIKLKVKTDKGDSKKRRRDGSEQPAG
ncbi:immobilization antigen [Micractinium conductrix]|uniref:Immobilization antigen n=1 Tax=Micractinium conductrix TaxID=554055 RepID=A0A2P6VMB9_9CHLO|nr:immobilization antigen [Micractinium conductrix]|eukprot:PSC75256.1 immobilization antigen [Micractinium conductrix]